MPFDLITVPCLSDNYAFILRDGDSGEVAVIDVPEAGPIEAALAELGWSANQVCGARDSSIWSTRKQAPGILYFKTTKLQNPS